MRIEPSAARHVDRLRAELARHPRLRGRPMPEMHGDEFAVWLEVEGREVARIEERGRHRWWGTGKLVELRRLADELVTMMERKPSEAEVVDDLVRFISGI